MGKNEQRWKAWAAQPTTTDKQLLIELVLAVEKIRTLLVAAFVIWVAGIVLGVVVGVAVAVSSG